MCGLWSREITRRLTLGALVLALSSHAIAQETAQRVDTPPSMDMGSCLKPDVPKLRSDQISGTVTLRFLVTAGGQILKSELATSSGIVEVDRAVLSALNKCRVRAAMLDHKPVQAWLQIQYVWSAE